MLPKRPPWGLGFNPITLNGSRTRTSKNNGDNLKTWGETLLKVKETSVKNVDEPSLRKDDILNCKTFSVKGLSFFDRCTIASPHLYNRGAPIVADHEP